MKSRLASRRRKLGPGRHAYTAILYRSARRATAPPARVRGGGSADRGRAPQALWRDAADARSAAAGTARTPAAGRERLWAGLRPRNLRLRRRRPRQPQGHNRPRQLPSSQVRLPRGDSSQLCTQPKVPDAKVRGSQEGFQCVLVSLERVPGVRKDVRRGHVERVPGVASCGTPQGPLNP